MARIIFPVRQCLYEVQKISLLFRAFAAVLIMSPPRASYEVDIALGLVDNAQVLTSSQRVLARTYPGALKKLQFFSALLIFVLVSFAVVVQSQKMDMVTKQSSRGAKTSLATRSAHEEKWVQRGFQ